MWLQAWLPWSEAQLLSIGFNAGHALAIKGAPGTLSFLASNGEITAADNAGGFQSVASPFNFLRVARVELQRTLLAIGFDEADADDAGTSFEDELLDEGGLVHGKKGGGLSPCDEHSEA